MESKQCIFFVSTFILASSLDSSAISDYHHREARTASKRHHLIVGTRQPGDSDQTRDYIIERGIPMQIIIFEKTINLNGNQKITQVAAYDQSPNGSGAYASIIAGGPGYNFVKLRFTSQRGKDIYFVVELFGR